MTGPNRVRLSVTLKNAIQRVGGWFGKNLLAVMTLLVAIISIYLTADLEQVETRITIFQDWANLAVEIVTYLLVAVAIALTVVAIRALYRKLSGTVRRAVDAFYFRHVRQIKLLRLDTTEYSHRLAIIEERLRIGNHPMLNLPDNLVPAQIEHAVRSYGREQHIQQLWERVRPMIGHTLDGYLVLDVEASGAHASYHETRKAAEQAFNRNSKSGRILVHVIEADWE